MCTGKSYREIISEARFNVAQHMLADPNVNVQEIAHTLGYTDHGSFSRAFCTWTGLSPSLYRRKDSVS